MFYDRTVTVKFTYDYFILQTLLPVMCVCHFWPVFYIIHECICARPL